MAKTLAQKAADKQLEDAVLRALEAYKVLPEGHSMIEFAVAIEGMSLEEDEDGDMPDSIGILFRNGVCRTAVARGLFGSAYDSMRGQIPLDLPEGD